MEDLSKARTLPCNYTFALTNTQLWWNRIAADWVCSVKDCVMICTSLQDRTYDVSHVHASHWLFFALAMWMNGNISPKMTSFWRLIKLLSSCWIDLKIRIAGVRAALHLSDLALAGSPQILRMLQALEYKPYFLLPSLLKSVSNGLGNAEFTVRVVLKFLHRKSIKSVFNARSPCFCESE